MAGDITVALRADAKPFEAGTDDARRAADRFTEAMENGADDASEAFEDVIRQLVLLGTRMGKTRDDLVRDLQKVGLSAEDAEDAISAIERETATLGRDGSRDVERASDALDDLGDHASDASDEVSGVSEQASDVGDGLRSLGDIAKDVLEGDLAGAASTAGEALGGIAGTLAGGAVGGAIASAVGSIVGGWIESWQKAAEESEKRIATWAERFVDAQDKVLTSAQIASEVQAILLDSDRYKEAETAAELWGVSVEHAAAAMAGHPESIERVSTSLAGMRDAFTEASGSGKLSRIEMDRQYATLGEASTKYQELIGELDTARGRYDTLRRALGLVKDDMDQATESVQGLAQGLGDMPKEATVKLTVDDSAVRNYRAKDITAKVVYTATTGTRQIN